MNKSKLLKLSLASFIAGLLTFVVNYFFYHFVTDKGITTEWQEEAGKPFVAELIGELGVLFIFAAIFCLIAAFVICGKSSKEN